MKHRFKVVAVAALCFTLMINSLGSSVQASERIDEMEETEQEELEEEVSDEEDASTSENEAWPEGPDIVAGSAVVMDVETGLVLYEKNATEAHYPASITKILTTLVAIENCPLTDIVTFSKDSVFNVEGSLCGIDWGEELTLEDCLYGIMLESGNEAAYAVAEHVGGTFENFVDMMNEKATELGCVNSHFANPHGLTDEDHYTCAYDMALIATEAIKNTEFATIAGARTHTVAPTNKQSETRYWANHHKFVKQEITYDGCIGGKTGWTTKSRYTLVTYAKRGDMTLVCVLMDEESSSLQYSETATLLDYGFDNFSIQKLQSEETNPILEDSNFFSQYNTVLSATTPMLSISDDAYVILPIGVDLSEASKTVSFYSLDESEDDTETQEDSLTREIGTITYTYLDRVVGGGTILLNLSGEELPTVIHSTIETMSGSVQNESGDSTSSGSNSTDTTADKEGKANLKPLIVGVILAFIAALVFAYYYFVERPRIRRRKAYLERRKNRRYY